MITTEQALDCFSSDDLIGLGMEADSIRRTLHPEGVVTYHLQTAITTIAEAHRAIAEGATGLLLQPQPTLAATETLLAELHHTHPTITLEAPASILHFAQTESLPLKALLDHLADAGLTSLADTPRLTGQTLTLPQHRQAHRAGLRTQATLIFGAGETPADRVAHLQALRDLQAETAGFTSFTALAAPAANGRELDEATGVEYLKTLAIARIVLDTLANIEADALTQGPKVLQMALRFGANDAGHPTQQVSEEELRRIIRDAGFQPAQRNALYTTCFLP